MRKFIAFCFMMTALFPSLAAADHKPESFHDLQKACSSGDAESCYTLGRRHHLGTKGAPQDYSIAEKLYRRACDAKIGKACYSLAKLYHGGIGVPQDYGMAVKLYQQACETNSIDGCANLGYMYTEGIGVAQDASVAAEIFHKLCINSSECYDIGWMYLTGFGVPQDYIKAYISFSILVDQGNIDALRKLESIAEKMTPKQIAQAEELTSECLESDFEKCYLNK